MPSAVPAFALLVCLVSGASADNVLGSQNEIRDLIPTHREYRGPGRANNWAILPEVGYSPDQKLNAGAKFTGRDLGSEDITIDGEITAAEGHQRGADASVMDPRLFGARGVNLDEYHYNLSPDKFFFGLGNNHERSAVSVHSIQRQRAKVTLGYHLTDQLVVAGSAGIRQTLVGPSPFATDTTPSTQSIFPNLVGIHGGRTNPLGLSFIFNNRSSITRPTRGWTAIGSIEHVNQNLANDFHFTRFTFDTSYLHPVESPDRVFGVRINGEYIVARADRIPFFELASLGGADDMRGFFPDRFLGTSRLFANAEYRDRLVSFEFRDLWDVQIDGVLFTDAGRVFLSGNELADELNPGRTKPTELFEEFRYSYGAGLRIELGEATVARIDAGFSNEATGLVYLVFGHTF